MPNYSVIDASGLIVNRVVIANAGDWTPPAGYSLVAEPAMSYAIGGTVISGVYTPPPQPAPPQPTAAQIAETARQDAIKADADRAAMLARLKTATSAQIDAWVTSNVTTLADARKTIGIILKLIALDARQ